MHRSPAHDAEEEIIQKRKHKVRPAILRSVPPLRGSSLIKIRAINVPIFESGKISNRNSRRTVNSMRQPIGVATKAPANDRTGGGRNIPPVDSRTETFTSSRLVDKLLSDLKNRAPTISTANISNVIELTINTN